MDFIIYLTVILISYIQAFKAIIFHWRDDCGMYLFFVMPLNETNIPPIKKTFITHATPLINMGFFSRKVRKIKYCNEKNMKINQI